MSKYTFIDNALNSRTFADETNRLKVLAFTLKNGTAGKSPLIVPILRTSMAYTAVNSVKPEGCADACGVLVTRKVTIDASDSFSSAEEFITHLDEAVRVYKLAYTTSLSRGFLPPVNSTFDPA